MKKNRLVIFAVIAAVFLLLNSCGLFMSAEAEDMVGLWRSTSWESYSDNPCYYDFRADGTVIVTDYTDDFYFYNYAGIPVNFYYSVSEGDLIMTQFFGLLKFEFEIDSTLTTDNYVVLDVLSSTGDYGNLNRGDSISLTRVLDYNETETDAAARAFFEGVN